jgi:hypothetical protein
LRILKEAAAECEFAVRRHARAGHLDQSDGAEIVARIYPGIVGVGGARQQRAHCASGKKDARNPSRAATGISQRSLPHARGPLNCFLTLFLACKPGVCKEILSSVVPESRAKYPDLFGG